MKNEEIEQAVYEGTKKALKEFLEDLKVYLVANVEDDENGDLTPYQQDVLNDLRNGRTPSEIAKKHGITPQAIRNMKNKLKVKGYLPLDA
ncbi:helix-turn-helix transcriptional regulator [Paenibacillus apii]|uniref:helix-turn-helix transcriptional regulator n=1 Tax=Paenibacillus apii TaxID=1850370 RepID=UPI00143C4632|nr:helix-turn-helix domain-containing protein [Paenibacillus apii]NJJ37805.1 MarR family transcriptional regulator [Paenibacillus apii]